MAKNMECWLPKAGINPVSNLERLLDRLMNEKIKLGISSMNRVKPSPIFNCVHRKRVDYDEKIGNVWRCDTYHNNISCDIDNCREL